MVGDCEPSLYQAFMDANSFNYQIPAKENSGEISSDGEFNEMEQVAPFLDGDGPEPDVVVVTEYENLVKRRFAGDQAKIDEMLRAYDPELMSAAFTNVQGRVSQRKHLRTRLVKNGFSSYPSVFPRWASDGDALAKIVQAQKANFNPEAIFGKIDPRNQDIDEMFADLAAGNEGFDQRGSSGKTYKDASEFASPMTRERKKIDTHNISQLSNFNPLAVDQTMPEQAAKSRFPVPG